MNMEPVLDAFAAAPEPMRPWLDSGNAAIRAGRQSGFPTVQRAKEFHAA